MILSTIDIVFDRYSSLDVLRRKGAKGRKEIGNGREGIEAEANILRQSRRNQIIRKTNVDLEKVHRRALCNSSN